MQEIQHQYTNEDLLQLRGNILASTEHVDKWNYRAFVKCLVLSDSTGSEAGRWTTFLDRLCRKLNDIIVKDRKTVILDNMLDTLYGAQRFSNGLNLYKNITLRYHIDSGTCMIMQMAYLRNHGCLLYTSRCV